MILRFTSAPLFLVCSRRALFAVCVRETLAGYFRTGHRAGLLYCWHFVRQSILPRDLDLPVVVRGQPFAVGKHRGNNGALTCIRGVSTTPVLDSPRFIAPPHSHV
ncbi:unnamed protein product [Ectocarpus sp. 4 AP-2014]